MRNVDVRAELEQYLWDSARWTDTKLIAASPFRYDKNPSFFCNYDRNSQYYGVWGDSGAEDEEWKSGGFTKLLSFLRDETWEETRDYLLLTYSVIFNDEMTLPPLVLPSFPLGSPRMALDESKLVPYMFRHEYLFKRGISETVQLVLGIGYCRRQKAVTIPWRLPEGQLANIKYRNVNSKIFWYEKGGWPIKNLVYNIDRIYKKRIEEAVICEAEIDAMSFMSAGIPAIAVGYGGISREQASLICRSPLKRLFICVDNDTVGQRLRKNIYRRLGRCLILKDIFLPPEYKDANEVLIAGIDLSQLVRDSKKVNVKIPVFQR